MKSCIKCKQAENVILSRFPGEQQNGYGIKCVTLFYVCIIIWPQLGQKCSQIRPFSTIDTQMVPLQAQSISFKISLNFKKNL